MLRSTMDLDSEVDCQHLSEAGRKFVCSAIHYPLARAAKEEMSAGREGLILAIKGTRTEKTSLGQGGIPRG